MFNTIILLWATILFQQYDGRKKLSSRESKDIPMLLYVLREMTY